MADTGTGATLTLATTGSIGTIRSMTLPEAVVEDIETTDLSTTSQKTFIAADLADPGEMSAEVLFDATANSLETFGASETVTVTFPIHTSGNTTNATLAGTGYIKGQKFPDLSVGELQVYTLTIKFDGQTALAWTAESA